jgi:nucleoside-diphosphate-sugar epimerase
MRVAVTGAFGFSGKYIAWRLLDLKHDVITLTNSPHRGNPFNEFVKPFPYNFSKPHKLESSLYDVDVLINTYWVRFDKPPYFSFAQAAVNSKILFEAAKRAGVRRLIHISITHPDRSSDLRSGCKDRSSVSPSSRARPRIGPRSSLNKAVCSARDRPH